MDFCFTTVIDTHDGYEYEALVTYSATPEKIETRYGEYPGFEINVKEVVYSQCGCECEPEYKLWQKLEQICQERAEEHFFDEVAA